MKFKKYGWMAATGAVCVVLAAQVVAADAVKPAEPAATSVSNADATVVGKMGTLEVQRGELEKLIKSLPPQAQAQIKADRSRAEGLVRTALAEKALLQQAQTHNWAERPEVKAQIEAATRQIIFQSYLASVSKVPADFPSDKELSTAYEQSKSGLVEPAMYRVSQIFFAAPVTNAEAVAKARKEATEVAKEAQSPNADFEMLIKKYSDDSNAKNGGSDTGFVPLTQLLPEIRPVVADLHKGEVSAPVQSAQGFHILKLVDERPQRTATFDEVRDRLRMVMRQERQQQMAQAYLQGLLNNQSVTIDGPALTSVVDTISK